MRNYTELKAYGRNDETGQRYTIEITVRELSSEQYRELLEAVRKVRVILDIHMHQAEDKTEEPTDAEA